jgi:hypothetical protein
MGFCPRTSRDRSRRERLDSCAPLLRDRRATHAILAGTARTTVVRSAGIWARLLRDRRGTAAVEAALLLPLMTICWAALLYRYEVLDRTLDAAAHARQTAWSASDTGCENSPPEVEVKCQDAGGGGDDWTADLDRVPVVGWFVGNLLGYRADTASRSSYERPVMFGGGTKTAGYSYSLMCNEKQRSESEVLLSMLCQQINDLGLDLSFAVTCPGVPPHGDRCQ